MKNRAYIIVSKKNLLQNIKNIKAFAANKKFCAVIKDNGYGHGATNIAKIMNPYVDFFAVSTIEEALNLKRVSKKNILILSHICNKDYEIAIKAMNRKYNHKFYGNSESELTWKFWFFPSITTARSLKIIDKYYQDQLRYIATGRHNKKNYKIVPYKTLKECNYKSLVHEYYKTKI